VIDVVVQTQETVTEIDTRLTSLESRVDRLVTVVDGLAKSIDDLLLEYASIVVRLDRYERWFKEIAKKDGD
jgi:hypothetical protein